MLLLRLELTIEVVLNEPEAWAVAAVQARALGEVRQAAAGQMALRTVGRTVKQLDERISRGEAVLQERLNDIEQRLIAVVEPLRQGQARQEKSFQKHTESTSKRHLVAAVEPLRQGQVRHRGPCGHCWSGGI